MINELQKDVLQPFIQNDILVSAVKAIFKGTIENCRPKSGESDSNELLGEKFRAYETAVSIIEQGFTDLLSYKTQKNEVKKFNKGR